MRSSTMTRGFRTITLLALAGAAVLVFHTAAYAQQPKPDTKKADKAKAAATEKAKPEDTEKAKPEDTDVFEAKAEEATDKAEATEANQAKPEPAAPAETKPAQPEDLPPEYAPPPGYRRNAPPPPRGYPPHGYGPHYDYYYGPPPYPPPRYYRPRRYPAQAHYYPEPMTYRPFFFGIGLGIGGVAFFPEEGQGENSSRAGMSYNLHFGFGVSPHWSIVFAGDGAYAYFSDYGASYDVTQSVWTIGPQVFINRHLYARAGIGVARKSVDNDSSWDYYAYNYYSDSGLGGTLAVGWEFMQSYHASLGLEAAATFGRYKDPDPITASRSLSTIGVNFLLKLF
jgi:hypothetical protein